MMSDSSQEHEVTCDGDDDNDVDRVESPDISFFQDDVNLEIKTLLSNQKEEVNKITEKGVKDVTRKFVFPKVKFITDRKNLKHHMRHYEKDQIVYTVWFLTLWGGQNFHQINVQLSGTHIMIR